MLRPNLTSAILSLSFRTSYFAYNFSIYVKQNAKFTYIENYRKTQIQVLSKKTIGSCGTLAMRSRKRVCTM